MKSTIKSLEKYLAGISLFCCLISGCSKSQFNSELDGRIQTTKEEYDAEAIRNAVMPLFKSLTPSAIVSESDIPSEITSLPIFTDTTSEIQVLWGGASTNILMFITGGGFGHWGLVVCRHEAESRDLTVYEKNLIPWEDGLYFYHD